MFDSCFAGIVGSLWLWVIDNRATHTGHQDDGALDIVSEHLLGGFSSDKVGSVEVDVHELEFRGREGISGEFLLPDR